MPLLALCPRPIPESIEQCQVVVQCLHEPSQEISFVVQILLNDVDKLRSEGFEEANGAKVKVSDA